MASLVGIGGNYLFSPASIAGLQLWLDGADPLNSSSRPAVGAAVPTWSDKSGNARNGTGVSGPTYVSGGGINFNGTSQYYTTTYTAAPTNETVFIVVNYNSVSGSLPVIGNNGITGARTILLNNGAMQITTYGIGGYALGVNSVVLGNSFLWSYTYTSSLISTYYNGTIDNIATGFTAYSGAGTTTIGYAPAAGWLMNGIIYEVIIYNTVLSTNDRIAVERFLNNKWNVTIPVVFLRANTYTGSGTWFDQSGDGFNATLAAGAIAKNAAGNGIVFTNGSTSWNIANIGLTNSWTLNVWYRKTSPSETYGAIFGQLYTPGNPNSTNCSLLASSYPVVNDFTMNGNFLDSQLQHHRGTPFAWLQNTWANIQITWDGSYMKTYMNSVLIGTTNTVLGNSVALDGGSVYSIGFAALTGDVGEIRVYRYAITAAQILADYNSSLGIFPVTTTGPLILLQAKYYSGVGVWYDQSGYGRNATLAAGTARENVEGNGIVLNGSTFWTFPNVGVGNAWTANVWFRRTGTQTGAAACILTQSFTGPSMNIIIGDNASANNNTVSGGFYLSGEGTFNVGTVYTLPLNTWVNIQVTWNGANVITYINGSLNSSVAYSKTSLDGGQVYNIGKRWDSANGSFNMIGEIGEVRIYNYALTATQVLQDYNNSLFMFPQPIHNVTLAPSIFAPLTYAPPTGPVVLLQASSYSGSGTWNDTSGFGRNATATGTISKNASGNGIVLNGSTFWTFANVAVGNAWTASVWFRRTGTASTNTWIVGQSVQPGPSINLVIGDIIGSGNNIVRGGFWTGSAWQGGANYTLPLNIWVNIQVSWNGANMITYINGALYDTTAIGASSTDNSAAYVIGKRSDQGTGMIGEIGEVRIYNYALNAGQVLYDYNVSAPMFSFSPTTLSVKGPVVLLQASFYSGSGTWNDRSGFGRNATLGSGTIAKNAAGNGIVLNGSTHWTFPNPAVGNAWTASIWFRRTGNQTSSSTCILTQQYTNSDMNIVIGDTLNANNNAIQAGFFRVSPGWQRTSGTTPVPPLNTWVNILATWNGTSIILYINSSVFTSVTSGQASVDGGLSYNIGKKWDDVVGYVVGEIGEVRIYNYALSEAQVQYEYNLSAPTFVNTTVAITGPVVLLQASSYSGSGTWNDTSGFGRNASLASGTIAKNADGNGIVLNGSSHWSFANPAVGNAWTASVWFRRTGNQTGASAGLLSQQFSSSGTNLAIGDMANLNNNTVSGGFFVSGVGWVTGTTFIPPLNIWINIQVTWSGSSLLTYINGTLNSSVASSRVAVDNGQAYNIGKRWDLPDYMVGEIGEVRIYNYALSAAQVSQDYNSSAPTFRISLNAIPETGPAVLLQAISYSGSGVWNDQSGFGRNATLAAGTIAKNAAGNGIVLNGSTFWTFPNVGVGNAWTANVWFRRTGNAVGVNGSAILTQQYVTRFNISIGDTPSTNDNSLSGGFFNGAWTNGTVFTPPLNTWVNIQVTWNGANLITYINGILNSSGASSQVAIDGGLQYYIGRRWDSASFMVGEIGEVRIYRYALTAAQVLQDYNLSAATFGLASTMLSDSGTNPQIVATNGIVPYGYTDGFPGGVFTNNVSNFVCFPLVAATFYTFSCWFYLMSSSYQRLWSLDTSVVGGTSYVFNIDVSGNNIIYAFANYSTTQAFVTGPILNIGTWYHLAVTFNTSTRTLNMFVNGYTYGSTQTGVGTLAATNFVKIGRGSGNVTSSFAGDLRNFTVYNSILSPSQIQDIYTQPPFTPASIDGLQMWLDGADPNGSGVAPAVGTVVSSWADKSGNGFNGTGVASPTYVAGGGISFNGSTQGFTTAYTSAPLIETVFLVARTTITTNPVILGSSVTGGRSVELGNLMYVNRQSVSNTLTGTIPVILNTPYLYDYTYISGGVATGFRNGSQDSTNASSPAFTTGGTTNIGVRINNGYWSGTISEVVIYNRVLSTTQRQQIESYLAWKWGIAASLPGAHPYYLGPLTLVKQKFNPDQILGLQMWLDGLDPLGTGILPARGTVISTWADKSGNGFSGTSFGSSTYVAGGGISFNGVNQFYTTPYTATPTAETIFVVIRFNTIGTAAVMLGPHGTSEGGRQFELYLSKLNISNYNIAGYNLNSITTVSTNTTVLLESTFSSGTMITYYNGTQDGTATGISYSGSGRTSIGTIYPTSLTPAGILNATIYDVITYNRVLSTSERQQVEGYLASKWSIQTSLPVAHQYYSVPPTVAIPYGGSSLFNPTSYSGLQMWLDGKDPLNTGTAPSAGAAVTTWADKSGNARNGTAVNNPTFIAGGGLSFNGTNQYYTTTYTAAPATETAFVIFSSSNPSVGSNKTPIGNNQVSGSRQVLLYISNMYLQTSPSTSPFYANVFQGSGSIAANTVYMYDYIFTSGGLATSFLNGNQDGTNNTSSTTFGASVTWIGAFGAQFFAGSILEVVIYNRILTTTERQNVEGYLAWKWGGSISLPGAHPFVSGPPTVSGGPSFSALSFTPGTYPGLQMWLDGQDPYNTGTAPNPGTVITTWTDKSGRGFSGTGINNPTYVAGGGISFNGTSQYYITTYTLAPTRETVFVIFRVNTVSGYNILLGNNIGYTGNRGLVTSGTNVQLEGWAASNILGGTGPTAIATNTTYMFSYTYIANGNTTGFLNGSQYLTNPLSYTLIGAGGTVIGYWPYLNSYLNGIMSEMIIYNTVLTTSQRQNVEGYLAWKWGLQGSLPSTHPFKLADPQAYVAPSFTALANIASYASVHLPLQSNTTDIGTSPVTVTTNGTISYSNVLGKDAIYFNNSTANNLSFPISNLYGMTFAFWFHHTSASYFTMASYATTLAANTAYMQFDLSSTTNIVYTALPSYWTNSPSATNRGVNTWNFITVTINQSTFVEQVYMNGSLANTATGTGPFSTNVNLFIIGKSGDNQRAYQGFIQRFMFFNTILSAAQVNTLYRETI